METEPSDFLNINRLVEEDESFGWNYLGFTNPLGRQKESFEELVIWLKQMNHLDDTYLGFTDSVVGAHQGFIDL